MLDENVKQSTSRDPFSPVDCKKKSLREINKQVTISTNSEEKVSSVKEKFQVYPWYQRTIV